MTHEPSDHEATDHEALMKLAVAGDRAAIGRLFMDHMDRLLELIQRQLPSHLQSVIDAHDIQQETLRVAWRDIGNFELRDDGSFWAWLKTIAEHQLLDAIKSQKRKKRGGDFRRLGQAANPETRSVLNIFDLLVTDTSTPLRKASRAEAVKMMQVALSELPEQYQDVVRLRFIEDLSYEEIAERMGRSTQAIHGLIKRAKASLREGLGRASTYLSTR